MNTEVNEGEQLKHAIYFTSSQFILRVQLHF